MIGMLVRIISKENKKKASISLPPPPHFSLSLTNSKSPSILTYPRFLIHQVRFSHSVSQSVGQSAGYIPCTYYSGTKTPTLPYPTLPYLMYIRYIHT